MFDVSMEIFPVDMKAKLNFVLYIKITDYADIFVQC